MNKQKKITLLIILSLILIAFISTGCSVFNNDISDDVVEVAVTPSPSPSPTPEPTPEPKDITITIAAVGDAMAHDAQMIYDYDRRGQNRSNPQRGADDGFKNIFNFVPSLTDISYTIKQADFAIANLETTVSGEEIGYSGYPTFNSPISFVHALQVCGFDMVTLANNHTLDYLEEGVINTRANLESVGMDYTGVSVNEEQYNDYYVKDVNGIKLGVVAYTYPTSKIYRFSNPDYVQRFWDDYKQIQKDIDALHALDADVIIMACHWGEEFDRSVSSAFKEHVQNYIAMGADIILGAHPHVVQTMDRVTVTTEDGETREGVVAYSLGNFVSNQRSRYNNAGVVLFVPITKTPEGEIILGDLTYVPTFIRHTRIYFMDAEDHRVLPAGYFIHHQELYDNLPDNAQKNKDPEKIVYAYEDVIELIPDEVAMPSDGTYIPYPYSLYPSPEPSDQSQ